MEFQRKKHWETIYATKSPEEVSWTQQIPERSLSMIRALTMDKSAKIIDVGGGDSRLVDCLLEDGYENISVLDVSENALKRAQKRLGDLAKKVTWIVADVTTFQPEQTYDIWHDRAAFHFLTSEKEKAAYVSLVSDVVTRFLIIGTFSTSGPLKCSGIDIQQYNNETLNDLFKKKFNLLTSVREDHVTPFGTIQNFLFCCFERSRKSLN